MLTLENLQIFNQETITGKYLDLKKQISIFVKEIDNDEIFSKLISELSLEVDANKLIQQGKVKTPTKPGYFVLPNKYEEYIPVIYTIFTDIVNGTCDLRAFILDYFDGEEHVFIDKLFKPFSKFLIANFELIKNEYKGEEKMGDALKVERYAVEVSRIVDEMLAIMEQEKRLHIEVKEDVEYLLNTLLDACKKEDLKYINALIISFSYMVHKVKFLRFYSIELKQKMIDFYL